MCGISGQYCFSGNPDTDILSKISSILSHRGPDDNGYYINSKVGLYHNRLSIIDISSNGHQPMSNEDGSIVLIYNGEIYNYLDLKPILIRKGHKFKSHTDTEVIIHAYEEWGLECLNKFEGMWSFALWDNNKKVLFCARDRFGIKPFYYTIIDNSFIFASEIKALLSHPNIKKEPNDENLNIFLSTGILDYNEKTMFKNIYQIKPSHAMFISDKNINQIQYYNININSSVKSNMNSTSIASNFMMLLKKAVKSHLQSDVSVGTCLSGGIDSSTIVRLIEIIKKLNKDESPQTTFSSVFSNKKFDESEYIRSLLGCRRRLINNTCIDDTHQILPYFVEPNTKNLLNDIDKLIYIQDEPFGSLSIYAQYCVMQCAHGKVKVLLDGQGADEILAGYIGYQINYIKNLFYDNHFSIAIKEMIGSLKNHYSFYIYAIQQSKERGNRRKLLNNTLYIDRYSGKFNEMLYNEIFTTNLPSLLHYEDRNSMAFSIESRVPYLDTKLFEYVSSLSYDQKIKNGITKVVLRNATKNLIPRLIQNRTDKMGFVTPEELWMKNELRNFIIDILNSKSFNSRKYWNSNDVKNNYFDFINNKSNYSPELWRIICRIMV